MSAGGGFGWGFTMACNEQVFLSVGGGAGAGVDGSAGNITGGGGGGGGMQGALQNQPFIIAARCCCCCCCASRLQRVWSWH